MTVRNILKLVALNLQKEDLFKLLNGNEEIDENLEDLQKFISCYNLVISELNEEFLPLIKTEQMNAVNGYIDFSDFAEIPLEIISCLVNGKSIPFVLETTRMAVGDSPVCVEYNYRPQEASLNSECIYINGKISERIIALGVVREYLLVSGQYEEAIIFDEKFKNALYSVLLSGKNRQLRHRRWF